MQAGPGLARRSMVALTMLLLAVGVSGAVSACGDDDSSSNEAASTSEAASGGEGSDQEVTVAQDYLDTLKNLSTDWEGPTTGPKLAPGKSIIYIGIKADPTGQLMNDAMEKAAADAGWDYEFMDAGVDPSKWNAVLASAIAKKPDGIYSVIPPQAVGDLFGKMKQLGIPYVNFDSAAGPGPSSEYPDMYTATTPDYEQVAKAKAAAIIVDSGGTAKWVNGYNSQSDVGRKKGELLEKYMKEMCSKCELLDTNSEYPTADPTKLTALVTGWVQKYAQGDDKLYIGLQTDGYADATVPILQQAGVSGDNVRIMSDGGFPNARKRVAEGDPYQVATVGEPLKLWSYQAIDEVNRYLAKEPPSEYVYPVLFVDKSTVGKYGGPEQFDPPVPYAEEYKKLWGL